MDRYRIIKKLRMRFEVSQNGVCASFIFFFPLKVEAVIKRGRKLFAKTEKDYVLKDRKSSLERRSNVFTKKIYRGVDDHGKTSQNLLLQFKNDGTS